MNALIALGFKVKYSQLPTFQKFCNCIPTHSGLDPKLGYNDGTGAPTWQVWDFLSSLEGIWCSAGRATISIVEKALDSKAVLIVNVAVDPKDSDELHSVAVVKKTNKGFYVANPQLCSLSNSNLTLAVIPRDLFIKFLQLGKRKADPLEPTSFILWTRTKEKQ